jgi:DNA-binding beta-propeller fold protein YncE
MQGNGGKIMINFKLKNIVVFILVVSVASLLIWYFSNKQSVDRENPYEYDISELEKIDPALIRYKEVQDIDIDFNMLRGIAVDNDDLIYLTGDLSLLIMDAQGKQKQLFNLTKAANCVEVDDQGRIYLGMDDHIQIYDNNGKADEWENLGTQAIVTSITSTNESIYVADAGNQIVYRYDKNGLMQNKIGEKNPAKEIPGFIIPSPYLDVAIDSDGFLWVTNPGRHELENFTPEGELRAFWGKWSARIDGFCGCCNPTHFALLSDGSFITSEKGLVRVKEYNRAGDFVSVVAGPSAFEEGTEGLDLAVDSEDRVIVLDPKTKKIRIFVKKHLL